MRISVLISKVMVVIVFFMLVRWSWPRFRSDQLMALAWKLMLPLGVINFVVVSVIEEIQIQSDLYGYTIPVWLPILLTWLLAVVAWISVSQFVSRIADNRPHRKLRPVTVGSAFGRVQ
tara:strand:- start:70 stop:423 length:354 start_codon:yes stop_codon:yes gene_type:complete